MTTQYPPWPGTVVQQIANVLGDTAGGLTGSEIDALPTSWNIPDPGPEITKRHRLRQALGAGQAEDNAANCVIRFITEAHTAATAVSFVCRVAPGEES